MISSLTFLWNKTPETLNMKYEICNKKYEIWNMITSLTVMWGQFHMVQKIWYEVLPMWISKVLQIVIRQIWPISHGVQFVSIYKHIQIQSGFQGYDQLTSVHTMSTLVQIFSVQRAETKLSCKGGLLMECLKGGWRNILRAAPVFLFFYQWSSILRSRCSLVISCSGWLLVIFR